MLNHFQNQNKILYFRNLMTQNDIQSISDLLATPKKIVIIPHRSPDGDAMGSTLALYHFLHKYNQSPIVIAPNDFPDFLSWLPASETVLVYENNKAPIAEILHHAEIIFTLDFNALHRTGEMEQVLNKLKATFIMIDHHQAPDSYAKYTFSDTNYGSTCEMVYHFINHLGKTDWIDKNIANCIYTGILTDSGGFRFPKTSPTTHKIVAELIEKGAENTQIPSLLYENNSFNSLQLIGKALMNMKVKTKKRTAFTTLSQAELDRYHYKKGDTEGIVNYGLTIKNIIFAAIFIENAEENIIKISFRSQGNFDVNQFARTHFEGGGHINAAGGKSYISLEKTVEKFETILTDLYITD
jgi:bifunctional oligoribonuclease and PAP phosphatase NrnA